ncbi:hypothetical protein AAG906_032138 [Vitis piasezkii]
MAKTSRQEPSLNLKNSSKEDRRKGRRDLVFAVTAPATCTVAKIAMADEPKAKVCCCLCYHAYCSYLSQVRI